MAQVIWNSDIDVYDQSVMPLSITKMIAKYLCVQDLWSFRQMSKNSFVACNDEFLWLSKLKIMDVKIEPTQIDHSVYLKELKELNPLSCMDKVSRTNSLAKFHVMRIHKCLFPYYLDLQTNKSLDKLKMFVQYKTPEDHAKILNNILRYNKIDFNSDTRDLVAEKINSLFEIFENAILRELEIHFDLQDFGKAKEFIDILIYLKNQQTLIDFFLQKMIFDNVENNTLNSYLNTPEDFFHKHSDSVGYQMRRDLFEAYILELAKIFNQQAVIIDSLFPRDIPMMYKVCEELISDQVGGFISSLILHSRSRNLNLVSVPYIYKEFTSNFIDQLQQSQNAGETYRVLVKELLDMFFESIVSEYVRDEVSEMKHIVSSAILEWNILMSKREEENNKSILKHVKVETKNDLIKSFKQVFSMSTHDSSGTSTGDDSYSEMEAKLKILSNNVKSLNRILSVELAVKLINEAKESLHRLMLFKGFSINSVKDEVISAIQEVFATVVGGLGSEHLKPGFKKATEYLKDYRPSKLPSSSDKALEPLVVFCELINMADLVIQMVDIFYKEEIVHNGIFRHENSVLNKSLQWKKNFEAQIDTYIADGLNVGIDALMTEIENACQQEFLSSDYNPEGDITAEGPSMAALKSIQILEDNFDLLIGCTDKSIVDVFQQEIAERLFHFLVKNTKTSSISVSGAVRYITDINLFYEFISQHIKTNKRQVIPLFQALKKVGNIFLISGDDSKAIGKLVSDLSKFNGIFSQEEIFEFVQRRVDWPLIKRDVEKVIYGLNLADCTIT